MTTRTVELHDTCTAPNCGAVLHRVTEAVRGTCSRCFWSQLQPDARRAVNRLIAAAMTGSEAEIEAAVDAAFEQLKDATGK